jgi:hypothetical protein
MVDSHYNDVNNPTNVSESFMFGGGTLTLSKRNYLPEQGPASAA